MQSSLIVAALGFAVGAGILASLPPIGPSFAPLARQLVHHSSDLAWLLILAASVGLAADLVRGGPRSSIRPFWIVLSAFAMAGWLVVNRCVNTKSIGFPPFSGQSIFWLDDDAMISMRYALNLAQGHGPVWNLGAPPIEGYSNPLWVAVMAVPHLTGLPQRLAPGAILSANGIILLAALFSAWQLARRMGLSDSASLVSLSLIAANRWLIHWTAGGSEAILLCLFILLISNAALRASRKAPVGLAVGLLAGLAAVTRADAPVLLLGFLPAIIHLLRSGRMKWSAVAAALAIPVLHLVFRRLFYGDWMPNTYYLKAVDVPMRPAMGLSYVTSFLFGVGGYGGFCALLALYPALSRRPRARWLAVLPWVCLAYAAFIGGDELPEMRFMVPVIPLLILGAVGAAELAVFGQGSGRNAAPRLPGGWTTLSILLALLAYPSLCLPYAFSQLGLDRGQNQERRNVLIGLLLEKNTNPDAKIAYFWAGAAPYFSNRPAQDMLGKNDAHIARLPGHPGEWPPGHVKYDAAYSMSLAPDVIVSALPADRLDPAVRARDPERRVYAGLYALYDDPGFKELYEPGLVPLALSREFHAIFVRKGSTAAKPPAEWAE